MAGYKLIKGYKYIAVNNDIHASREPLINGSRLKVSEILEMLASGQSIKEVCENYIIPQVAVKEALTFAKDEIEKVYGNDTG